MRLAALLLLAQTAAGSPAGPELFEKRCIDSIEGGRRDDAIQACAHAGTSPRTQALLANALLMTEDGPPSSSDLERAASLAEKALEAEPDAIGYAQTLCAAAQALQDAARLRACTATLQRLAPDDADTHAFAQALGQLDGAPEPTPTAPPAPTVLRIEPTEEMAEALAKVRELEEDGRLERELERIREPDRGGPGFWTWLGRFLLAWIGSLAVLLAAGWLLSRLTLRTAQAATSATGDAVAGGDLAIKRAYRFVLWLSCLYYWISLPLLLVLVLGGGGMLIQWISAARVDPRAVIGIGFLTIVSAGSIILGLVTRPKWTEPGLRIDPHKHPRLKEVLREVAVRVGTRPVSAVFLTPDTDIAVTEPPTRTGVGRHRERWLILGAGALQKFPMRSFKAVLAHEYGHFANEDTAAGGFAISVLASLRATTIALAEHGGARWFNPAWVFLRVFTRVFLRISHGATRLQEILADRVAASAYGSKAFEDGLSLAIQRGIAFNEEVSVAIRRTLQAGDPLDNVYELLSYEPTPYQRGVAKDAMTRALDAYDTHPPAAQRIDWVRKLAAPGAAPAADDAKDAWELFDGRLDLERKMTERLRARLALAGIAIRGAEHTPTYVVDRG